MIRYLMFFFLLTCLNAIQVTIDTGLSTPENSNRAISQFNLDVLRLTNGVLEWGHSTSDVGKMMVKSYFVLNYFFPFHVGAGLGLAYHEFGHGGRAVALGYDSHYELVFSFQNDDRSNALGSYFDLFNAILRNPGIEGAYTLFKGAQYSHISSEKRDDFMALIMANGLNNETYFAAQLADYNYTNGRGHVLDIPTYLTTKLSVQNYVKAEESGLFTGGGDITHLQDYYRKRHQLNLSNEALKTYSMLAFLLSAQTWSYYGAIFDYMWNDQLTFPMSSINGWRLPELDFYLNAQGPSYQVRSNYDLSDSLSFPFAIEYVFLGNRTVEYTVGANMKWTDHVVTRTECRIGGGLGLTQRLTYFITQKLTLSGGWVHYNGHNLFGARHSPSFKRADMQYDEFFTSLEYDF